MQVEELPKSDAQPRVFLQPTVASSIPGLYGLAVATFMVAARMANSFGSFHTTLLLFHSRRFSMEWRNACLPCGSIRPGMA